MILEAKNKSHAGGINAESMHQSPSALYQVIECPVAMKAFIFGHKGARSIFAQVS